MSPRSGLLPNAGVTMAPGGAPVCIEHTAPGWVWFSSDRAIQEYAEDIWQVMPLLP